MGGFEGEGGKKQRRSKKPRTAQGVAFQEEIERGSQEFISTLQPPQPAPQDASRLTNHSQQQDFNNDTNHEHNYEGETVPINRQVQQLQDYLESEDHMLKKLLEEKHWEEVYDGMFSRFYECSAKTSDWGDPVEWNRDFKLPCRCTHTRTRPVVLIDIFTRKQEEVIFCDCQRDQMRLVQMGYIGGAPKFPCTAFSIRLLRLHHILWKRSGVTMSPFSKSIDEFLDAYNPLILVPNSSDGSDQSYHTREWRRTMSSAVDAYREMLQREKLIHKRMLAMGPLDKLADKCPKCHGPLVNGKREDEPHCIVCMDGNFQHCRHLKASVEIPQLKQQSPSLFVEPQQVSDMERKLKQETQASADNVDDGTDRCTQQHTAADDVRTGKTWKECDNTGLFGMACRHNQILQLINIVQSGEKAHFPMTMINKLIEDTKEGEGYSKKLGFLYDIGCNIEKGIIRRNQFPEHLEFNLLRFANQTGAVHLLLARGKHIEQEKTKSSEILRQIELEFGHNLENLKGQWDRQRAIQLAVMETATEKEMLDQIEELVELEDKLREANRELHELRQTRRRRRTTVQSHRLEQIPETLTFIEAEIGSLVAELGSENFRNLPGASNAQSKALIKLKISKSKLYEAKVGVVEMQRKWDTGGSGTRVQARYKKQMNEKVRLLKNKWLAYDHRAQNYNSEFTLPTALETPTLEEVKSFGMEDAFWNMGPVSHPNEPWAIDLNIQKGISAYLTLIHCQDELNRISREARQAVKWAIQRDKKMEEIYTALNSENQETDVLTETQTRMANISSNHHFQKSVLQSIFQNSAKRHCRLWMSWNQKCRELLSWSNKYVIDQTDENSNLLEHWDSLIVKSQDMWEKLVKGESVIMEFGDQADHEEEEILDQEVLEHQGGEPEMLGTIN
ncbi:hypothetical protein MJO28_012220 [Puccinia striiformis f. sp. tritici]|uniref:Uncharacterized protein n=1 Tax=Puccinia striiformis f. sp. tritici TaxID=168172 RepID=A0ACC0E190_9BASI|nr:hypothetical protein MJO28_012220 [Puccinia striiformis f. sp. tritici]